jgi:hypothetical protein
MRRCGEGGGEDGALADMMEIIRRGEATEEHKKKITRRRRTRRDAQRKEEKGSFSLCTG